MNSFSHFAGKAASRILLQSPIRFDMGPISSVSLLIFQAHQLVYVSRNEEMGEDDFKSHRIDENMKRSSFFFLISIFLSTASNGTAAIQWSKSYHKLVTGSSLEITLESNPSTGFDWFVVNAGEQYVDYLTLEKKEFLTDVSPEPMVGVPGTTRFLFKANKPVTDLVLLLAYKRPWELDYVAAYHVAIITMIDHVTRHICHPVCQNTGTLREGWYSSCTQELIKYEKCADLSEPYCGALKTRSEGWYTSKGLINYDRCFDARIPVPQCINEGQDNEGWDTGTHFIKAPCQGLEIACAYPLSKSEGFWAINAAQNLTHVEWTLCMLEDE